MHWAEPGELGRVELRRLAAEESDRRHRRLLRGSRERPRCGRAAKHRNEIAPPHVPPSSPTATGTQTALSWVIYHGGGARVCGTSHRQSHRWARIDMSARGR